MKILIGYYSESGNTEKIAESIYAELENHDVVLKKITEIPSESLKSYDLIFLGSPVHTGGFPKKFNTFIKEIPEKIDSKIVSFFTYGVPIPDFYDKYEPKISKMAQKKGLDFLGTFKCLGEHRLLHVLEKLNKEAAEKARIVSKGHPNDEDISNAKNFAKEILSKLN
ncbi:MAG: hypothetical protein EAX96_04375 [Candidatus Lokiarchaeota archaeon]|nr:hypothetical protein [Candidatus Lokiarchaeota archaeon]